MSASIARLIEVADAIVINIRTLWEASSLPPGDDDAVQRVYEALIGDSDSDSPIIGRQVYVFPTDWARPEIASRGEDFREHVVAVLVAERYTGQTTPVPLEWMDARLTFVEEIVWRPHADLRYPEVLAGVWPHESDVTAYDVETLKHRKLFLSFVSLTLREII